MRELGAGLGERVALVALGGYGRRILCPGSDVDLMVLHAGARSARIKEAAERVFYPFWDAGMALGHAVRTVGECIQQARGRVDAACSLLDGRPVWGDRSLFDEMTDRLERTLRRDQAGFMDRLRLDAEARHERHPSCSASLEPDLKEGAGGLRDVHSVGWVSRVVLGGDAVEASLLRGRESKALEAAEEFLVRLRSALHLATGRRADRLFLEHQPELAGHFGFQGETGLDVRDALMRSLFEQARQVEHVTEALLERVAHRTASPSSGHVDAPVPSSPEEVMAAFGRAAAAGRPLAPESLDAIEGADLGPWPYRWTGETARSFLDILAAGEAGARALEAMDRGGLLTRFLPEWEAVRCRPQRDPYHRFSVDVHLVRTTVHVACALAGEAQDDPVLWTAAAAIDDRDAVLLGAFLHDIGKVGRGRHVEAGVRIAASVLERMGVGDATRNRALFLVAEHLLLPDTATRRDLSDENLVIDVTARIGDPERLAMAYMLAVADAEATGPHARTAWRLALIRELVGKVQHVLESGEMGPDRAAILEDRLDRARRALAGQHPHTVDPYLARLPRQYVLAVSPETVARHFRMLGPPLGAMEVRTEARLGERAGTYELTVVASDRPGLLSKIAGSLALSGLNILSAQAFTTEDGVAIDLFVVETAFEGEADEGHWRRFRSVLRRALEGRLSLEYRVREKRRHYPASHAEVPTKVTVFDDVSDFYTVIEVSAGDRIGLLFDLARTFHDLELDVHLAKVATYGPRVVDAFYVRDLFGRKVEDTEQAREIQRAVASRLADR